MDGRNAAMNVLTGVVLGGAVPIIGTFAFEQAQPDFVWIDHFLTIVLLCILCAAIGVLVNLPWNQVPNRPRPSPHARASAQPEPEYVFDAGFDEQPFGYQEQARQEQAYKERRSAEPATSFAMSRRQAFRTLELEINADESQIRDAFRRLAKAHHPDHATTQGNEAVAQATQKFREVRAAYEVLLADGENAG